MEAGGGLIGDGERVGVDRKLPKRTQSREERGAEAEALRKHILDIVGKGDKSRRDFVYFRFERLLIWYGDEAPKQNRIHARVALTVIAGGLLSSGLAAIAKGQSGSFADAVGWAVIVLGLIVGVGTGWNQIARPSQKSMAYADARDEMRREGWDLVGRRGRYKNLKDEQLYGAFMDVVLDLEMRTAAVGNAQGQAPHQG
jgi:hypothetical protein